MSIEINKRIFSYPGATDENYKSVFLAFFKEVADFVKQYVNVDFSDAVDEKESNKNGLSVTCKRAGSNSAGLKLRLNIYSANQSTFYAAKEGNTGSSGGDYSGDKLYLYGVDGLVVFVWNRQNNWNLSFISDETDVYGNDVTLYFAPGGLAHVWDSRGSEPDRNYATTVKTCVTQSDYMTVMYPYVYQSCDNKVVSNKIYYASSVADSVTSYPKIMDFGDTGYLYFGIGTAQFAFKLQ